MAIEIAAVLSRDALKGLVNSLEEGEYEVSINLLNGCEQTASVKRKNYLKADEREDLGRQAIEGKLSIDQLAKKFNVSCSTVYKARRKARGLNLQEK